MSIGGLLTSAGERINKLWAIHTKRYFLATEEKKNVDESQKLHIEGKKSNTKTNKNLKKKPNKSVHVAMFNLYEILLKSNTNL